MRRVIPLWIVISTCASCAFVLASGAPASAVPIVVAPALMNVADTTLECSILNVDSFAPAKDIVLEIVDMDGDTTGGSGSVPINVPPSKAKSVSSSATGLQYCLAYSGGSMRKTRLVLMVRDAAKVIDAVVGSKR